jgi:DNA-binding transcriptional regulator YiaG
MPQVKVIRRALEFTQEEFAVQYRIPTGHAVDWEQGVRSQTGQHGRT